MRRKMNGSVKYHLKTSNGQNNNEKHMQENKNNIALNCLNGILCARYTDIEQWIPPSEPKMPLNQNIKWIEKKKIT